MSSSSRDAEVLRLALEILPIAPWKVMGEDEVFAVTAPSTGERFFVRTTGAMGQVLAVMLYRGEEANAEFERVFASQAQSFFHAQALAELPLFEIDFNDRDALLSGEAARIKAAGIKCRGPLSWPSVRYHEPGRMPAWPSPENLAVLEEILPRVVEVLRARVASGDPLSGAAQISAHTLLASGWVEKRIPRPKAPARKVPKPEPALVARLRALDASPMEVEADMTLLLAGVIRQKQGAPTYTYIVPIIDVKTAFPVAFQMVEPLPDIEAARAQLPELFVQSLEPLHARPGAVRCSTPTAQRLLRPLCEAADIRCEVADQLPALEMFVEGLTRTICGEDAGFGPPH